MSEHILTQQERDEYDAILYEAGYLNDKPRPSHEIGPELLRLLADAENAGREWAVWVRDDLTVAGAVSKFRQWRRQRDVVTVAGESYTISKPAAMGVRKRAIDGSTYYQATLWADMTRDELEQILARSAKQIESESQTIAIAKRLLSLLSRVPEVATVGEACAVLELDTEAYLGALDEAA